MIHERNVHPAGPAPAGFRPTGPFVLRLHPCGGEPIDQPIGNCIVQEEDPGSSDRFELHWTADQGVQQRIAMSVTSWNPFCAQGCLATRSGHVRVGIFTAGAQ